MTIFRSQFDKLAPFSAAFVGGYALHEVVTPDKVDAATIEKHAVDVLGAEATTQLGAAGMFDPAADLSIAFPPAMTDEVSAGAFGSPDTWMHRGDYTDMGVGGGSEGFYFIDSESSYSAF